MNEKQSNITLSEIKSILETNQKSIEIYIEVEKQNEEIIKKLEKNENQNENIIDKLNENDEQQKNIIKLLEGINSSVDTQIEDFERFKQHVKTSLEDKISEIEKNIFRLIVILGTVGVGTIISVINMFLKH